jgi:hypothetical protein
VKSFTTLEDFPYEWVHYELGNFFGLAAHCEKYFHNGIENEHVMTTPIVYGNHGAVIDDKVHMDASWIDEHVNLYNRMKSWLDENCYTQEIQSDGHSLMQYLNLKGFEFSK